MKSKSNWNSDNNSATRNSISTRHSGQLNWGGLLSESSRLSPVRPVDVGRQIVEELVGCNMSALVIILSHAIASCNQLDGPAKLVAVVAFVGRKT